MPGSEEILAQVMGGGASAPPLDPRLEGYFEMLHDGHYSGPMDMESVAAEIARIKGIEPDEDGFIDWRDVGPQQVPPEILAILGGGPDGAAYLEGSSSDIGRGQHNPQVVEALLSQVLGGKMRPDMLHPLDPNSRERTQFDPGSEDIAYDAMQNAADHGLVPAFGGDHSMKMVQQLAEMLSQAKQARGR